MLKTYLLFSSLLLLPFLLKKHIIISQNELSAFPGAEGFGARASGGRGGMVAEVTNLNDSGPGSLRYALSQYPDQPLTVIFRIGGIIELKSNLKINRSNITIAGQTAPDDGICLKGNSLIVNGASGVNGKNHGNIIIRFLRSRPGNHSKSGSYGIDIENAHDIIIDHCSFSWANEECAAIYDVKNITMQWCIISEGLYDAGHQKGKRSYGGVWGGQNASFHHNLIANQMSRTVRFNGSRAHDTLALVDYRNNVVFNWGSENACYGGEVEIEGGNSCINFINNYYLPGAATNFPLKFFKANYNAKKAKGSGHWFVDGNIMHGDNIRSNNNKIGIDVNEVPVALQNSAIKSEQFSIERYARIKTQTASRALRSVISNVGANVPRRDGIDRRIIASIGNRLMGLHLESFSGIINSPKEVGGWPEYKSVKQCIHRDHDGMEDSWELKMQLNPENAQDRNKINKNGYTMLEVYLNSLVPQSHIL